MRSTSSSSRRNQSKTSCVLTTRCWQLILLLTSKPVAWSTAKADPSFLLIYACMSYSTSLSVEAAFQSALMLQSSFVYMATLCHHLLRCMLCLMLTNILHLTMVSTNTEQSIETNHQLQSKCQRQNFLQSVRMHHSPSKDLSLSLKKVQ